MEKKGEFADKNGEDETVLSCAKLWSDFDGIGTAYKMALLPFWTWSRYATVTTAPNKTIHTVDHNGNWGFDLVVFVIWW